MDYGFNMTLTFAAACKGSCIAVGEEIIENWGIWKNLRRWKKILPSEITGRKRKEEPGPKVRELSKAKQAGLRF
jgi:hypothetical protein